MSISRSIDMLLNDPNIDLCLLNIRIWNLTCNTNALLYFSHYRWLCCIIQEGSINWALHLSIGYVLHIICFTKLRKQIMVRNIILRTCHKIILLIIWYDWIIFILIFLILILIIFTKIKFLIIFWLFMFIILGFILSSLIHLHLWMHIISNMLIPVIVIVSGLCLIVLVWFAIWLVLLIVLLIILSCDISLKFVKITWNIKIVSFIKFGEFLFAFLFDMTQWSQFFNRNSARPLMYAHLNMSVRCCSSEQPSIEASL